MGKYQIEGDSGLNSATPGGPLVNDYSCLLMRSKVNEFFNSVISSHSIDVIVSIPRKGTWMIDDALHTMLKETDIIHVSFGTDDECPGSDKTVMIFDDSINTGTRVSNAIEKVRSWCPKSIVVSSLAINKDAKKRLKEQYGEQVIFETLKEFDDYKNINAYAELNPECQNYFFAVAILPYVYTLDSNRNPGFCNWIIGLSGHSDPHDIMNKVRSFMSVLGWEENVEENGVAFENALRLTFDQPESTVPGASNGGFQKVRFSLARSGDHFELSVAPILCPDIRCDSVREDIDGYVMGLSKKFIQEIEPGLLQELNEFDPKDVGYRNLNPVN